MSISEITESDVVAWLRARIAKADPRLKVNYLGCGFHAGDDFVSWSMHGLSVVGQSHENCDMAELELASKIIGNPKHLIESKRKEAAELLADADELEGVR